MLPQGHERTAKRYAAVPFLTAQPIHQHPLRIPTNRTLPSVETSIYGVSPEAVPKPIHTGVVDVPVRTNDRRSTVKYPSPPVETPWLRFRFLDAMASPPKPYRSPPAKINLKPQISNFKFQTIPPPYTTNGPASMDAGPHSLYA